MQCSRLRITAATTTLTLLKRIIGFAPLLLPRFGLRLQPQEIGLLIAASAASFSSGKTNGVVAANVSRNAQTTLLTIQRKESLYADSKVLPRRISLYLLLFVSCFINQRTAIRTCFCASSSAATDGESEEAHQPLSQF